MPSNTPLNIPRSAPRPWRSPIPGYLPPIHRMCRAWPDQSEVDFGELKRSIDAFGMRDPILLWHDHVVDGRHRMRAARECGRDILYSVLSDDATEMEVMHLVESYNAARRNLSTADKALLAARQSLMPGIKQLLSEEEQRMGVISALAARRGVSRRSVIDARAVVIKDDPELLEALRSGEVPTYRAAALAREGEPADDGPPAPEEVEEHRRQAQLGYQREQEIRRAWAASGRAVKKVLRRETDAVEAFERTGRYVVPHYARERVSLFDDLLPIIARWQADALAATKRFADHTSPEDLLRARERIGQVFAKMHQLIDEALAAAETSVGTASAANGEAGPKAPPAAAE